MAELSDPNAGEAISSCCPEVAQRDCCDPADKDDCCSAESTTCGCSTDSAEAPVVREAVRERYAAAAKAVTDGRGTDASCCAADVILDAEQADLFGAGLYGPESSGLPDTATMASLGCGNPTAIAELREGEVVLDLGSGGGIDVLLSARRVAPGVGPTVLT